VIIPLIRGLSNTILIFHIKKSLHSGEFLVRKAENVNFGLNLVALLISETTGDFHHFLTPRCPMQPVLQIPLWPSGMTPNSWNADLRLIRKPPLGL
jgi:hypothetical protein